MREFVVDEIPGIPFELFGLVHLLCVGILILGIIMIYRNRHRIEKIDEKLGMKIKIGMILIWLLNRFIYMGSYAYYGIYTWKEDLPLHFCFIAGYLFVYSVLFKKKQLFKIVYFFAFMGPLTATIWPDLTSSLDYLIFYEFFISHHIFILSTFFIFYLDKIDIKRKDIFRGIFWANVVFLGAFLFNNVFETNYIMSQSLPDHVLTLYPFLRHINYPIIVLEITGIVVIFLSYIPVYLRNKEDKHLQDNKNLL